MYGFEALDYGGGEDGKRTVGIEVFAVVELRGVCSSGF